MAASSILRPSALALPCRPLTRLAAMAHDAGDDETERWFLEVGGCKTGEAELEGRVSSSSA